MKSPKRTKPPKWPRLFFEWFCNPLAAEDLIGDVDELFYQNLDKMSVFRARYKYTLQLFTLLFSYAVKNRKRKFNTANHSTYHAWAMYQSYSKLAFRNLAKQKAFSVINIVCLSVGMSVGLLALAAFTDVLEVDRYQANANRIYRITTTVDDTSNKRTFASSSQPLAERISLETAGIQEVVQLENTFSPEVKQGTNITLPLTGYYATPNFFDVFTFPLLEGNAHHALEKPFTVVITESTAEKLFRDISPLGKVIELNGLGDFEITGVVKTYARSHLYFEILASYSTLAALEQQGKRPRSLAAWGPVTKHYTYLMLHEGKEPVDFDPFFQKVAETQFTNPEERVQFSLQQLTDIPMTELYNEIGLSWGFAALAVFFSLALLVLLPACFNYTNISIARALKRGKEIGLRKVSGGTQRHIFLQMVLETIILAVISLAGAMIIFYFTRNEFINMVVDGTHAFDLEITPAVFALFLLFAIFTGFAAGVFPATYFSRLNPIETLRSATQSGKLSKISIRKGLIVGQFALSMVFILGVTITLKQYHYALNYDLGFRKENILTIPLKDANEKILRTELAAIPEINGIAMSSSIPGSWGASSVWVQQPNRPQDSLEVFQMFIDGYYLETMEMQLVAGNSFSSEAPGAGGYIIVNETFLKKFDIGSPHEALDKSFLVNKKELRIGGVIRDFNHSPLQEQISSFFFRYDPAQFRVASVKLTSDNIPETLKKVEASWNKVSAQKFEAYFLDDQLQKTLVSFISILKIFGFLGILAITISALGLLAVVISAAETRTREMSIRKIMGASVSSLAITLSKGFFKLIVISVMIAVPFTYFLFDKLFLKIFYYRTSIGLIEIASSITLLFALVCLIIGSQTLKVARINPVETLKTE